jgi:uncharacterized protein YoxC
MKTFAIKEFEGLSETDDSIAHDDLHSAHAGVVDAENLIHESLAAGSEGIETAQVIENVVDQAAATEVDSGEQEVVKAAVEGLLVSLGKQRSDRHVSIEGIGQTMRTLWIKLVAFLKKIAAHVSYYIDSVFNMDKVVAFKLKRLKKKAEELLKKSEIKFAKDLDEKKRYATFSSVKYANILHGNVKLYGFVGTSDVVMENESRIATASFEKILKENMSIPFSAVIQTAIRSLTAITSLDFLLDPSDKVSDEKKAEMLKKAMSDLYLNRDGVFSKSADTTPSGIGKMRDQLSVDEFSQKDMAGLNLQQTIDYVGKRIGKISGSVTAYRHEPKVGQEQIEIEVLDLNSIKETADQTLKQIDGNQALRKLSLETKKTAFEFEKKINDKRTEGNVKEVKLISLNAHVGMRLTISHLTQYMKQHTSLLSFMAHYIAVSLRAYQ